MIIAISQGLVLSLLEVRLPVILATTIEMLDKASAPVALFVIGGVLYGVKTRGVLLDVGQIAVCICWQCSPASGCWHRLTRN